MKHPSISWLAVTLTLSCMALARMASADMTPQPRRCPVAPPCECIWETEVEELNLTNTHVLDCSSHQLSEDRLPTVDKTDHIFTKVNFSDNYLDDIPRHYLDGLRWLEVVAAAHNQLLSVPHAVRYLPELLRLHLQHNLLALPPASTHFARLTLLEFLDLSHNRIAKLTKGLFKGLVELEELVLSNNKITSIEVGVFDDVTSLISLDLSANAVTQLEANVFLSLTSLEELDMEKNKLKVIIPGAFNNLTALVNLTLGGNRISTIYRAMFSHLKSLDYIGLDRNDIAVVPVGVFQDLHAIEWIDLTFNSISSLAARTFLGVEDTIHDIDLGLNNLISLPDDIFKGMGEMTWLELYGNKIKQLPSLKGLHKLKYVYLLDTHISELYPCDFVDQKKLKALYWGSSPINCDCNVQWLKQKVDTKKLKITLKPRKNNTTREAWVDDYYRWVCHAPHALKGRHFVDLPLSNLTCAHGEAQRWCHQDRQGHHGVTLNVSVASRSSRSLQLLVQWQLGGMHRANLADIHVTIRPLDAHKQVVSLEHIPFDQTDVQYDGHDLTYDTTYTVCVSYVDIRQMVVASNCTQFTSEKRFLPKAAFLIPVVCGFVAVVVLVVIAVIFKKYRLRGRPFTNPALERSQDGISGFTNVTYDVKDEQNDVTNHTDDIISDVTIHQEAESST